MVFCDWLRFHRSCMVSCGWNIRVCMEIRRWHWSRSMHGLFTKQTHLNIQRCRSNLVWTLQDEKTEWHWTNLMSFPNFHTSSYISTTVHYTNPYITPGWPVKIRTDFGSAQNAQLLDGFFARTELLALAGVDSLVLVGQKQDQGKSRSFSAVVGDFCSLPVRAHRCRTVSLSVH